MLYAGKGSPKFEVDIRKVKFKNNKTEEDIEFGTAEEALEEFGYILGKIEFFATLHTYIF